MVAFYIIWKWRCFFPNQLSFNNPSDHYICARLQYKLVYIPTTPLNLIFLLTHRQYVLFSPYIKFLYFCSGVKKIPENPKYLGEKKTRSNLGRIKSNCSVTLGNRI